MWWQCQHNQSIPNKNPTVKQDFWGEWWSQRGCPGVCMYICIYILGDYRGSNPRYFLHKETCYRYTIATILSLISIKDSHELYSFFIVMDEMMAIVTQIGKIFKCVIWPVFINMMHCHNPHIFCFAKQTKFWNIISFKNGSIRVTTSLPVCMFFTNIYLISPLCLTRSWAKEQAAFWIIKPKPE